MVERLFTSLFIAPRLPLDVVLILRSIKIPRPASLRQFATVHHRPGCLSQTRMRRWLFARETRRNLCHLVGASRRATSESPSALVEKHSQGWVRQLHCWTILAQCVCRIHR